MNDIIKKYYEKNGVKSEMMEIKRESLDANKDIAEEFLYWINNRKYLDDVRVEGYVASDIATMSPYLNGEGAFMILMELRKDPNKAKDKIKKGFSIR